MDLKLDPTSILTAEDLDYSDTSDPPEVRAARNPDWRILIALLSNFPPRRYKYHANRFIPAHVNHAFHIPLIAAIKSQLPTNVRTLLDLGANPNGYPLEAVCEYAAEFWRFRGDDGSMRSLGNIIPRIQKVGKQNIPVTTEEIEERKQHRCTFWRGWDSSPLETYAGGEGITALEEACKHSSTEILEMIINAQPSPDVSFWMGCSQKEIPEPPSSALRPSYPDPLFRRYRSQQETSKPPPAGPSYYSVSNPLICAIKNRQNQHLTRLLDLGFNPNSMPLACRQQCYSPLMATVLCCSPPNWEAFSILICHPLIDINILTPIMGIHILHLITALLSLPDLSRFLSRPSIGVDISEVLPTAAGHTLLHIACLPLNITHVNVFSEYIYRSAREFRHIPSVSTTNRPSTRFSMYILHKDGILVPQPTDFFPAQKELAVYLLANTKSISAQDCHGNTALHYLAMGRTVNKDLLDELLKRQEISQIYVATKNSYGRTAEDLMRDGKAAVVENNKSFWSRPMIATLTPDGIVGREYKGALF